MAPRLAARFAQGQRAATARSMPMPATARRPRRPQPRRDRAAGRGAQAAAGREMEPEPLRRQRDADRPRRHLVSPGQPDRPAGDGAAVLDHPAARAGRRLRAGHAGREARHRGRGRAVRRGRAEERGRRRGAHASPSGSTPATWSSPGRSIRLRFEARGRAAPLSRGPRRPRGAGRPPGLLRAGRDRAGRRRRRRRACGATAPSSRWSRRA